MPGTLPQGVVWGHPLLRLRDGLPLVCFIQSEGTQGATFACSNDELIAPITIQIDPAHTWPCLALKSGQEHLAGKIIEKRFVVTVVQLPFPLFHHQGLVLFWRGLEGFVWLRGIRIVDRAKGVGRDTRHLGKPAIWPSDAEGMAGTRLACKSALGIIPCQVAAATQHMLDLRRVGRREHLDARANSMRIAWSTLQAYVQASLSGKVFQQPWRLIQALDDHILVSVSVQIGQGRSVGNPDLLKGPVLGGVA